MNPSTMKKRWVVVGTAAVLGVAGASTAAALNDPAPRTEATAAVALDGGSASGEPTPASTADPSPESADSPNESATETPGSAQSADSPDDANYQGDDDGDDDRDDDTNTPNDTPGDRDDD